MSQIDESSIEKCPKPLDSTKNQQEIEINFHLFPLSIMSTGHRTSSTGSSPFDTAYTVNPYAKEYHSSINQRLLDDDDDSEEGNSGGCSAYLSKKSYRFTCCGCCTGWRMTRRRFLSIVSLITLVLVVVVTIIFLYAIIPLIISSVVGHTNLNFSSILIEQPTNSSVMLTKALHLTNVGPWEAILHSANLTVYQVDDKETILLGYCVLPDLHINGDTSFVEKSEFFIANFKAFGNFAHRLINTDSVEWLALSTVDVTPIIAGIHLPVASGISFRKNIILSGCGGLKQNKIESFAITQSNGSSVGVAITVSLYNPSIFALAPLGNLYFHVLYEESEIGLVTAYNVNMMQGENLLFLAGILDPKNLSVAGDLMARYLTGKPSPVTALASTEASSIPLYAQGLAGVALQTQLNGEDSALIGNYDISTFAFDFGVHSDTDYLNSPDIHSYNDSQFFKFSLITTAPFKLPENVVLQTNLTSTQLSAQLVSPGNKLIGSFDVLYAPVDQLSPQSIMISVPSTVCSIENLAELQRLSSNLVLQKSATTQLIALATPTASTPLGILTLPDIPASQNISLQGFNSFLDSEGNSLINVLSIDAISADAARQTIAIRVVASFRNPTNVNLGGVGTLQCDFYAENGLHRVGTTKFANFSMASGVTMAIGEGELQSDGSPQGIQALANVFSNYLNALPSVVTVSGLILKENGEYSAGTSVPALQPAISQLKTNTPLPGLEEPFIIHFTLVFNLWKIFIDWEIPCEITIHNPFDVDLTMTAVRMVVLSNELGSPPIGYWFADISTPNYKPIFLPGKAFTKTVAEPIKANILAKATIEKLIQIATSGNHETHISVYGNITAVVGGTPANGYQGTTVTTYVTASDVNTTLTLFG
jgi:hypothetical protein